MSEDKDVRDDNVAGFTLKVELLLEIAFAHGLGLGLPDLGKKNRPNRTMVSVKFKCQINNIFFLGINLSHVIFGMYLY